MGDDMPNTKRPRRKPVAPKRKAGAVEKAVTDAAGGAENYAGLQTPLGLRAFLQDTLMQRYRNRQKADAIVLGENILGLVFEENDGQFYSLPPLDLLDIKTETAMVVAWIAAQEEKAELFGRALKALRELDEARKHTQPLTRLYRLHVECIGVDLRMLDDVNGVYAPDKAFKALKAEFKRLPPLPNVIRAVTSRYVKWFSTKAADIDTTRVHGKMTYYQWLEALRDQGLEGILSRDDGFAVGSVAIIEMSAKFAKRAMASGNLNEARRCYALACIGYAELFALHRAGKIINSPNAEEMLVQAQTAFLLLREELLHDR